MKCFASTRISPAAGDSSRQMNCVGQSDRRGLLVDRLGRSDRDHVHDSRQLVVYRNLRVLQISNDLRIAIK